MAMSPNEQIKFLKVKLRAVMEKSQQNMNAGLDDLDKFYEEILTKCTDEVQTTFAKYIQDSLEYAGKEVAELTDRNVDNYLFTQNSHEDVKVGVDFVIAVLGQNASPFLKSLRNEFKSASKSDMDDKNIGFRFLHKTGQKFKK